MEKVSFLNEVISKIKKPWSSQFIGYLLIVTVFGGIGVFFTAFEVYSNDWIDSFKIAESISVFFVAIIATSFIDLNLSPKVYNRIAFLIYSFIFYGFAVFLLWLTYTLKASSAFIPACIGLFFSLLVWVLANAENEKFSEENFYDNMRGKKEGHGEGWS